MQCGLAEWMPRQGLFGGVQASGLFRGVQGQELLWGVQLCLNSLAASLVDRSGHTCCMAVAKPAIRHSHLESTRKLEAVQSPWTQASCLVALQVEEP